MNVQSSFSSGFCDWKRANLIEHEKSKSLLQCVLVLTKLTKNVSRIDQGLVEQLLDKESNWRKLLRRLASVITTFVKGVWPPQEENQRQEDETLAS